MTRGTPSAPPVPGRLVLHDAGGQRALGEDPQPGLGALPLREPPRARLGDDQAHVASRPGVDPHPDVPLGAGLVAAAAVVGDLDVEGHAPTISNIRSIVNLPNHAYGEVSDGPDR